MKLTNGEIYNAREPLMQLQAQKFPVKTSLEIVRLVYRLNEHYQTISEVRDGLIRTYGEPDPDDPNQTKVRTQIEKRDDNGEVIRDMEGEPVMEANPKFPKFAGELKELMEQEVEVVIDPVALPDTLEIEPAILLPLEKFIKVA